MKRNPKPVTRKKTQRKTLTEQEQLFCDLILQNMNPNNKNKLHKYECYQKAYPSKRSRETASVLASNKLKKPHIQKYMNKRKAAAARRSEVSIQTVLDGLMRIANFDVRKLYNNNGSIKKITELDDDTALAISSIEYKHYKINRTIKGVKQQFIKTVPKHVRVDSKKAAWDSIGQHLNMFNNENMNNQTAQEFVDEVRGFATNIKVAVPGGKI